MGDTDFPAVMANWGEAKDKAALWRSNYSGKEEYSQSGTDIPEEGYEREYSGGEGSDIDPYFRERVRYK
tara:strand:- start:331 stop:537 length:207 start_codon:yes stop_codon:yes gene_type:complete